MTTSSQFDMSTPILPYWLSDIADDSPTLLVEANKPSRLLRLPGELRNRIWEMVVADFEPLVKHELLTYTGTSYISRFEILHPLALTCKQIRRELHPIFLSSTQFAPSPTRPITAQTYGRSLPTAKSSASAGSKGAFALRRRPPSTRTISMCI